MSRLRLSLAACWYIALSISSGASGAELTAEKTDQGVTIKVDGEPFAEYLTQSGAKPIVWPIIGPSGKLMTRSFPMDSKVSGEKKDHPHQRSLWFTHGDVNGVDFWTEFGSRGKTVHREFRKIEGGPTAVVETANDWVAPDGHTVCSDVRTLAFGASGKVRWIDFDITITAVDDTVKFGDTKEGCFGIRVPSVMDVDRKMGGKIVNSEGQTDGQAWGKPASWVDYHGPIDGQVVGITIMNHPSSFRFPTHWHVRTYGLFAANPFGLHDFTGSPNADGSHTLKKGESITLRYRVLFHEGDQEQAEIAKAFEEYAQVAK